MATRAYVNYCPLKPVAFIVVLLRGNFVDFSMLRILQGTKINISFFPGLEFSVCILDLTSKDTKNPDLVSALLPNHLKREPAIPLI